MKEYLKLLIILVIFSSCQTIKIQKKQEIVLDNKSHIEDNIHYKIDSLPRLCDELKLNVQYVNM